MSRKRNPRMVGLIHAAAKDLGLTEEERRAIYIDATGYNTITKMNNNDLVKVIDRLRMSGFKPISKATGIPPDESPQGCKIKSQWLRLHELGAVRNSSEKALNAYIAKRTGITHRSWLDSGQKSWIIEQLKAWIERVELQLALGNERTPVA